ncbi:response regulator transcription factor [Diplocloster modestus]|uniref:Stage 0 sporulation protein A homolog n=1 Tax=Diplocloster modestus TaxID=2850322 RepID=A0ABS6KF00_9FIRM|nr:response regulator [Diplocloster modestus]MBU9729093.1 response regulator [Diplocloster modestus]
MNKDMISIMIVDDEPIFIEEIKRLYDFEANGFDLVSEASNGKDALEIFDRYKPQIVISDIDMPIMDGITLGKIIRSKNIRTELLYLTVYDETEYIKSALRLSASDYILKFELSEQILEDKMYKLKQQILQRKKTEASLLQNLVLTMYQNNIPGKIDGIPLVDENIIHQKFLFLVLELIQPLALITATHVNYNNEIGLVTDFIKKVNSNNNLFYMGNSRYLLPFDPPKSLSEQKYFNILSTITNNLKQYLETYHIKYALYILPKPTDLMEFQKIYYSNTHIFDIKYFVEDVKIFSFSQHYLKGMDKTIQASLDEKASVLKKSIESKDIDKIYSYHNDIMGELKKTRNVKTLIGYFQSFYYYLENLSHQFAFDIPVPGNCYHIDDVSIWLLKTILNITNELGCLHIDCLSNTIQITIAYINRNFSKTDMTIDVIAEQTYLSAGRLNKLFKSETGITIYKYLKETRLNNAKHLLSTTTLPVYEISEKCGYSSSQYFSQVFYETFNMTPNTYRKSK